MSSQSQRYFESLQWRRNEHDGVSNHQPVTRKMFPFDEVIINPGLIPKTDIRHDHFGLRCKWFIPYLWPKKL